MPLLLPLHILHPPENSRQLRRLHVLITAGAARLLSLLSLDQPRALLVLIA